MTSLVGALRVSLSADTAQFEAGMRRAQRTSKQTATGIKGAFSNLGGVIKSGLAGLTAGLSVGLLTSLANEALQYAASLGEVAQQLGVTTRDLQVFRYAAGQTGISQEQMEKGLQKLTVTLGQLAAGAQGPTRAIQALGLSVKDLQGVDTGEAFRMIADKLKEIPDRAERAAIEVELFGKAGANLDNLLSGGSQAINQLASAAEELGIVLSDEQIQRADDTADKLEAVKTVLSARIAGAVADNAQAIYGLADSLIYLVAQAGEAITKIQQLWRTFIITRARQVAAFPQMNKLLFGTKGSAAILRAGAAAIRANAADQKPAAGAKKAPRAPSSLGEWQGGGGGGGGSRSRGGGGGAPARDNGQALRDAYQFDSELMRSQQDILRAQEALATDYSDRATLQIQMLDLDKQMYQRELAYEVASGDRTKIQAQQLQSEYDKADALKRQAVMAEEESQRQQDFFRLQEVDFEIARDKLESERQLAQSSAERRDVELRLLDLSYAQEKAKQEAVLADQQASYAAKEEARRRLAAMNQTYGNDRASVMQNTAGPMEQWRNDAMNTADAMEQLKVDGIEGAVESIWALTEGFDSFRETALSSIKAVLKQLFIMKAFQMISGAMGGPTSMMTTGSSPLSGLNIPMSLPSTSGSITGFAHGGSGVFGGIPGIDKNTIAMNGLPIMRVSKGEHFSVSKDGGGGGQSIHAPISINIGGNATRETAGQIASKTRRALSDVAKRGTA